MPSSLKNRLRRSFAAASATYRQAAKAQALTAARLSGLIPPGHYPVILEIGAGGGILTVLAMRRVSCARYLALDFAAKTLTPEAMGRPGPFIPLAADGERPPLKPGSADLLLSSAAMQWYADPVASIRSNLELVRPGGSLALCLFVSGSLKEIARAARTSGFGGVHALPRAETIIAGLSGLPGYALSFVREEVTIWHASVREALTSIKAAGASLHEAKPRFGKTVYQAFCRAYAEESGQDGRVPLTYEALYVWGKKG